MGCSNEKNFCVRHGATFVKKFYWSDTTLTTKAITAITQEAPVEITATGHGLVNNWRAAVVSARGMVEINAKNYPPAENEYHPVAVVNANQIQLTDVNSSDFTTYTSGGFLVYRTPIELTSAVATMMVRDFPETGTALETLTSTPSAGVIIDSDNKVITVSFETADTPWRVGYYDLEVTLSSGRIVQIATGIITIE